MLQQFKNMHFCMDKHIICGMCCKADDPPGQKENPASMLWDKVHDPVSGPARHSGTACRRLSDLDARHGSGIAVQRTGFIIF